MKKQIALKAIFGISIAGMLFSGFLSYMELFVGRTACGASTCGAAATINLGLPACVYGFIMYAIVFLVALCGLRARK